MTDPALRNAELARAREALASRDGAVPLRGVSGATRRFLRGSWAWLTLKPGSLPRRTARTVLLRAVRFVLTRPRLTRLARRVFERFPLLKRFRRRALDVLLADSVAPAPDGFWTEREQFVYARLKSALKKGDGGVTTRKPVVAAGTDCRPRLAFVSPLPPERTGIADYSADLLPALSRYYDIVLITDQKRVDTAAVGVEFPVHDPAWLHANRTMIDRVIYQMGNSHFHDYMRDLMVEIPGTVVLHDVFLSGLFSWLEKIDPSSGVWTRALYHGHGYVAVRDRYRDEEAAKIRYPVNLGVVQAAQGVIVHSEHARSLASDWLGPDFTEHWRVIPHLRALVEPCPRAAARKAIGLPPDAFVLCSFGSLEPYKLNQRLLRAFLACSLGRDANCYLIYVGETHGGGYGTELVDLIRTHKLADRVRITGR